MQRSEMYGTEGLSWVLGWKGKKQRWLHGSENAICFFPYVSMLVIFFTDDTYATLIPRFCFCLQANNEYVAKESRHWRIPRWS